TESGRGEDRMHSLNFRGLPRNGIRFGLVVLLTTSVQIAMPDDERAVKGINTTKVTEAQARAIDFLRTTQSDDGSWTTNQTPGISGLVIAALLESGLSVDDPTVQNALKNLSSYVQADGGIYAPKSDLRNYETCISLLAFHAANKDGRHDKVIA